MKWTIRCLWMGLVVLSLSSAGWSQAEQVTITLPASVTFDVSNITIATQGAPNPVKITFSDASLLSAASLRISVRANAPHFTAPGGNPIPASNVSWTTGRATGGKGFNGTLSSSTFTPVYESKRNPSSGSVDVRWRLAAPGAGVRAGNHSLTLTWKLESVVP